MNKEPKINPGEVAATPAALAGELAVAAAPDVVAPQVVAAEAQVIAGPGTSFRVEGGWIQRQITKPDLNARLTQFRLEEEQRHRAELQAAINQRARQEQGGPRGGRGGRGR